MSDASVSTETMIRKKYEGRATPGSQMRRVEPVGAPMRSPSTTSSSGEGASGASGEPGAGASPPGGAGAAGGAPASATAVLRSGSVTGRLGTAYLRDHRVEG